VSENSPNKPVLSHFRNPILWGILLTAVLGAVVTVLSLTAGPSGNGRFAEFTNLSWNEIGDTMAGVFAPLAFVWIVVTVFLQSQELAEQRRELSLTREELRLAREAQEAQLLVMQKQADIFEDERKHRDSENAKRVFDQLIHAIVIQVLKEKDLHNNFVLDVQNVFSTYLPNPLALCKGASDDEIVRSISDSLNDFRYRILGQNGVLQISVLKRKSKNHFYYRYLKGDLDYILSLRERLAEDQEVRLQSLGLEDAAVVLEELLNLDIWDHQVEKRS
jgi:hypothetical protein